MKYKILAIIVGLAISVNAFALLKFPVGEFVLQGKIMVHEGDVYLAINHKSNSETRIKLKGKLPKDVYSQSGSNAAIKLRITKSFLSYWGEAEFIEIKQYLDPFEVPAIYHDERALPTQ